MIIEVHVKPKARAVEVKKVAEPNIFQVSVTAMAIDGKANVAVVDALAEHFGVPKKQISLKHGSTGRTKLFEIIQSKDNA